MMKHIKYEMVIAILLTLSVMLCAIPGAMAGDPTGAETLAEDPDAPVNFVWVLLCAALVMFMQAGFAMVETGLTRAKNAANILMKNMMDFSAGALVYWAVGFAFMFGTTSYGLYGTDGFFLGGDAYDVSTSMLWFFQMVFCATAATIVSGAMAERTKFRTYLIYSILISAFIYPYTVTGYGVADG